MLYCGLAPPSWVALVENTRGNYPLFASGEAEGSGNDSGALPAATTLNNMVAVVLWLLEQGRQCERSCGMDIMEEVCRGLFLQAAASPAT